MKNLSESIIEALKKSNRLSESDLQRALIQFAKEDNARLRDVLVRMGLITDRELTSMLGMELKIPFLNLAKLRIDPAVLRLVPEKVARKHQVVPVSKIGNVITLAMADPLNIFAIDDIALLTQSKVDCVIATEKDIQDTLDKIFMNERESMSSIVEEIGASGDDVEVVREDEGILAADKTDQTPVVKIIDLLLREALKKRASDIHIEPFENRIRVRYRIDGRMQEAFTVPKKNQQVLLTRLKIMSKLDITENRTPQDGRFKIKLPDKEVDFRVSVLPVNFGSKVVMRILDKSALSLGLDHLGLLPETLDAFKAAVAKPFGMILITGPTGSGKTTTLYSILNQLNTPDKNVITIEDPIEYQVRGITQIQAKPEVGLDFAGGLRAILRQSPDVVMVGEIRDTETADISIKASLTGQIVLSTLHTNDASGAMTRLIDMGVEPFLIASSVVMVAAQRLCRRVCVHCRQKIDIPVEEFKKINVSADGLMPNAAERVYYKGKGCDKCSGSGYRGRLSVVEALTVDDEIRDLIVSRAPANKIKECAVRKGMSTLREDGLKKMCRGLTTMEEVIRATAEDE